MNAYIILHENKLDKDRQNLIKNSQLNKCNRHLFQVNLSVQEHFLIKTNIWLVSISIILQVNMRPGIDNIICYFIIHLNI